MSSFPKIATDPIPNLFVVSNILHVISPLLATRILSNNGYM